MPKREDEFWAAQKEGRGRGLCPSCGSSNISYNPRFESWRCNKCEKSFPSPSYGPGADFGKEARWFGKTTTRERRRESTEAGRKKEEAEPAKPKTSNHGKQVVNRPIKNWLWALLLIFALSIIGLGISIYIGSFIPFWLLVGFSCIYSVEKWFSYTTRKHKGIGKLYRLLLNLCILSLFGLLIWSGVKLFSQELSSSPLFGSLIFLAEFVFFIWMCRVIARNSWRFPSMKLTMSSLIGLFLVLAFAGVQPASSYKDQAFGSISSWFSSISKPATSTPTVTTSAPAATTPNPVVPSSPAKPPQIVQTGASYTNEEVEELVYVLINSERQSFGLSPLSKDSLLTSLAREHSISMATHGFFSHDRAAGERDFGYGQPPGTTRGENISETPQRRWIPGSYLTLKEVSEWAVSGWMGSTGHRKNILEPRFTKTGIGVSRSVEYLYITAMFEGAY